MLEHSTAESITPCRGPFHIYFISYHDLIIRSPEFRHFAEVGGLARFAHALA